MSPDKLPSEVTAQRRAARKAEIILALTKANRPLVPTMAEKDFQAMIERMAEHQLIYEEYSGEP
ncbi:MAG TPA: hypothetical protein VGG78_04660 [Gemmatimonadaceae bacterium]|jgi:hypothetical protein